MVPRYSFVDPKSGMKVDQPDFGFMNALESVLTHGRSIEDADLRRAVAQKFLECQSNAEIALESGKSVIASRHDNLTQCFAEEYAVLLSHRRTVEGLNVEQLRDAFFQRRNHMDVYESYPEDIRGLVEAILHNMESRYAYPSSIALDTVIFALRKNIIDFAELIS